MYINYDKYQKKSFRRIYKSVSGQSPSHLCKCHYTYVTSAVRVIHHWIIFFCRYTRRLAHRKRRYIPSMQSWI